jgi:hypothetical protein
VNLGKEIFTPSSKKSPFNIAPVDEKTVTIKEKEIDLGCFI